MRDSPGTAGGAAPAEAGRSFEAGGESWIARAAGESAVGHGAGARAYLVAVRFYRAGDDTPVSEILIPRGRLEALFEEELEELWRRATPLDLPSDPPARPGASGAPDEAPAQG